jgi:hypothetical protein
VKVTLSYFEYRERQKQDKTTGYVPLPQDIVPFILEEPIEVKESKLHPREFAKLFPWLAKPRSVK